MAGYEYAFSAICEQCEKIFSGNFRIYTVINNDLKSNLVTKLINDKLNTVSCPMCKTSFTYERPHLAYSFSKGYAVHARYNHHGNQLPCGRTRLFEMFGISGMRYRLVNYLCEVSEKLRIFESGLDDIRIEYLKTACFDSEYFADKANKILLFKELCDGCIIFEYRDYTGKVLESHKIPFKQYERCAGLPEPQTCRNGMIVWTRVDNNYIKEISND